MKCFEKINKIRDQQLLDFEIAAVQKYVNLVELVKSFPFRTRFHFSNEYLSVKIGFDTAEHESSKV